MKSNLKALAPVDPPQMIVPGASSREASERALWVGLLAAFFVYGLLFLLGFRFFIYKTAVMPIFVMYGVSLRNRKAFLTDWLPFLSGTVLFDVIRGAIFVAVQHRALPVFADYAIVLEKALFGTPAVPLVLQKIRTPGLDAVAVFIHGLHFGFFLLFGLAVWHLNRAQFSYYRRVMLVTMSGGLIGYTILPTVPPWLASTTHLLPPIDHVVAHVYTQFIPELYGVFDSNPVAAMPSLHAAFPTACSVVAWRAFGRRAGLLTGLYTASVIFSVMYLGEHYAVDVLAGIILAAIAALIAFSARPSSITLRQSITVTAITVAATVVILLLTR